MKCLVTGAAGFIGSRLCERLLRDGHEVIGLDDLSEGSEANLVDARGVQLIRADLRDETAVRKAADGCEVIFHQGAVRSVPRSMVAPGLVTDVNIRGTLNVLMAAQHVDARVISASSSSVYGDQAEFPLHEGLLVRPRSPYAASKVAGEVYCETWWQVFSIPTISLRYFNVFGPRQDPANEYATVVPRFVLACLTGDKPTVHGDGYQARDFTYIDDVVTANLQAAAAPDSAFGRGLNIGGGGEPTSINDLLGKIARLTGVHPEPIHTEPRAGDVRLTDADVTLAGDLIGYRPAVDIDEGLSRTVSWFADNLDMYVDGIAR